MSGSGAVETYGVLLVSGVQVALPLAALREVVPCPEQLSPLPRTAPGLVGALRLRSLVVPVLDLRLRSDELEAPAEPVERVVVLVAHDDHLLGVLADQVVGITRVPTADLLPVRAASAPGAEGLLFSHWFASSEGHPDGEVVSVLQAARLLSLPGVPTVRDPAVPRSSGEAGAPALGTHADAGRRTLTVVRCGGQLLAWDVEHVHTTVYGGAPESSVLAGGVCQGVTTLAGREVPVVDTLAVLGLGTPAPQGSGAGLVLDVGTGLVVLSVSDLLDLRQVRVTDVLPLPAFAIGRPELFDGLVDLEGLGQVLVVDGRAVRAADVLVTLGRLNSVSAEDAGAGAPAAGPQQGGAGPPLLSYRAGVDVLSPVGQVTEILPMPDTLTSTDARPGLLGIMVHRSAAVPVVSLPALLGLPAHEVSPQACLLLVLVGEQPIAFAVDALRGIVLASWQDLASGPASPPAVPEDALRASPLVAAGDPSLLLPVIDLEHLARLVLGSASAPDPDDAPDAERPQLVPA